MTEHAVVIAGGGPTGMMLAGELALAGIDAVVIERRSSPDLEGSRAGGLHSRTIEVLDQRGIADRFLAEGQTMQVQSFGGIPLDISDFPTRHNYGLALWQSHFERILAGWVDSLGVEVRRRAEVTGFTQNGDGVRVELADGRVLATRYLIGCDGGRSLVRKAAGIGFPGWDATRSTLIAEVELSEEPPRGVHRDAVGTHGLHLMEDGRTVRVVVSERCIGPDRQADLEDLRTALIAVWGTDFGVHNPTWISRFTDMTRQAVSYREGRVLLAGDAAHVHYPIGGQGLNTGVQDAVNLGWKLAQVLSGTSPDSLLDTYHAERHPVAARVLQKTMAMTVLARSDDRIDALRDTLTELFAMEEPRRRMAGMLSGLDIRYQTQDRGGGGHPLAGRRIPDFDLRTDGGSTRVYTLLHQARPLLLDLREGEGLSGQPPDGRVRVVTGRHDGRWELPVVGEVPGPPAVLVRPDGYVAWAGELPDPALDAALATWFGSSRSNP